MFKKLIIINVLFAAMLVFFSSIASADNKVNDSYGTAVIGHVIQSKVNGTNVDVSKLFEQEMEKVAHQFTLDMIVVMQKYLPAMLDGLAADLRLKADAEYKCQLLDNTKIKDDCK